MQSAQKFDYEYFAFFAKKIRSMQKYYQDLRHQFAEKGNPHTAEAQMAYMKHHFAFYGLKMPAWMALTKAFHQSHGIPEGENLKILARLCFEDEHRELHYFALETVQVSLKKQEIDFIEFLEELILEKSWWDSVDWLSKLAGLHFKRFPELLQPKTECWMASGQLWLQRAAITCQRFHRKDTNAELLFQYVERVAESKEFFCEKEQVGRCAISPKVSRRRFGIFWKIRVQNCRR